MPAPGTPAPVDVFPYTWLSFRVITPTFSRAAVAVRGEEAVLPATRLLLSVRVPTFAIPAPPANVGELAELWSIKVASRVTVPPNPLEIPLPMAESTDEAVGV